ncbi:MAG TPA: methyltransferase domain-containing protein [Thiobacillaceae bacterium]|nr:methyltransferase domain-containing protein [Thiobacillaceae bacterium]HNU65338.1 methyltransferase domain-containing protein [Thiobacillaceae bacterium]
MINAPTSALEPEKSRITWGRQQANSLWKGLYERYAPRINDRIILDFGCSWGYMLMYLHEMFHPRKTIGVDLTALWDEVSHGWDYKMLGDGIAFYSGEIQDIKELESGSVDLVLCTSVLQYLRPEQVLSTLERIYDILRPGGEMILRTRCFTSYIGADMHSHYTLDYVHMLYPLTELKKDLSSWRGRGARYLNYLCASNYVTMFYQSGLEIIDIKRRMNSRSPELLNKLREMYPHIELDDLLCAELEARLIRPVEPAELDACGTSVTTMPTSSTSTSAT